jgi:hypothetical protein
MSTYRKERNIIIISLDGASGNYRLDINTGILYGIKGNPIKACPRKSEVRSLFPYYRSDNGSNLTYLLHRMIDHCDKTSQYAGYVPYLLAADKIDALGYDNFGLSESQYEYVGNHIKELNGYMRNHEDFCYSSFKAWCEFEKVRNSLGVTANLLTAEMYAAITRNLPNITADELGVCAYYLGRGKYWEYHNGSVGSLVTYIEQCRLLEKAPQKANNFMREYCETRKAYELRKTEFDNKQMAMNYAKYAKAWEFAYGDYVVSIPTTAQDIVTEGERMHHCVGSYVGRVVEGQTYICFVRHKDTPNTPYITCQVYTNGEIGQYFLAYDRYISTDRDKAFKEAFARHLREVWGD